MCVTLLPCSHCRAYRHGLIWTLFCQTAWHLDMVFMAHGLLVVYLAKQINVTTDSPQISHEMKILRSFTLRINVLALVQFLRDSCMYHPQHISHRKIENTSNLLWLIYNFGEFYFPHTSLCRTCPGSYKL